MLSLNTIEGQEFVKELSKSQLAWADVIFKNLNIQQLDSTIDKSRHLLAAGHLYFISKEIFMGIIHDIVRLLETYQPKFKRHLTGIKSRYEDIYNLLTQGSESDLLQWANNQIISPIVAGQLIDWSLRPKKIALAKLVQPLLNGEVNWESQFCPVCGEQADTALLLKENGERHLGCSCCQITWRYPRLKCISCENANPETLKYYFVEEAPEQQIHYCESCGSYLKTFDYRFSCDQHEDLMLLNYMTAHLDVLAEQKGLGLNNKNYN